MLIFGGVTVLGGGPRAHTPHPEELPNPPGASNFSFDLFYDLLWSHEACEFRRLTRVPPPSRSCWRSFQDGPVVSSSPRLLLGKSLAGRGLFFLGDFVGRWMWPGWSSSHDLLPPPRRAGLSALGSFWVVTPPPPPSGALPGTFHRKEADPARHRVFFVFPSRWRMWGRECEPPVSGCQSPLTSSLCWLLNSRCFQGGLPSSSRDFGICHNERVSPS